MRQKLLFTFLAIATGIILAFCTLFYLKQEEAPPTEITVQVLQIGVYESLENALKAKEQVKDAIVYEDENVYRVLVGAATTSEALTKIETALQEENIAYYKKELQVKENEELFTKYNELLEATSEQETVLFLNHRILERMEQV